MATQVTDLEIKSFVRKVQQNLLGLSFDDVRELTENLEEDLKDRRDAEGKDFKLGNPKTYASELTEAAGLNLNELEVSRVNIEFLKAWKATIGYLRTLSPAWAILRGWVLFSLIYSPIFSGRIRELPNDGPSTFILLAFIAISVWLSLKQFRPIRIAMIALNVVLLLGSTVVVADVAATVDLYKKYVNLDTLSSITFQGNPVNSLCAVDQFGNKYPVAQLLDAAGYEIFNAEGVIRASC